jgi:hypothetical protein
MHVRELLGWDKHAEYSYDRWDNPCRETSLAQIIISKVDPPTVINSFNTTARRPSSGRGLWVTEFSCSEIYTILKPQYGYWCVPLPVKGEAKGRK